MVWKAPTKAAARTDWVNLPFAQPREVEPPSRTWTNEQWELIQLGRVPDEMEDKWFCYVEETRLHVYRSWTGNEIFDALFEHGADGWRVVQLVVEGDAERFRAESDAEVREVFGQVIDGQLLDRTVIEADLTGGREIGAI